MAYPKIKLSDDSGNAVGVTDNRLNVNAYLSATPTIDIGDVSLLLGGTAASVNTGVVGAQTLRVTLATDDQLIGAVASAITNLLGTIDADTSLLSSILSVASSTANLQADPQGGVASYGQSMLGVRNDVLAPIGAVVDGDYSLIQVNALGALYITGGEVENAAVQSEPLLIGGRYDSSARTLGDGDAGAVALNASGHVIMDVVDGGQLDTIIDTLETTLTAIETDQAAIEALLITIDSDTDAIKTAVEILDDWDAVHDSAVSSDGVMMMGEAKTIDYSWLPNSVAEGDAARMAVTQKGIQIVTLTDQNGMPAVLFEDLEHTSGAAGIMPLAVRNDTLAALADTDGDYAPLQVNATGALYIDVADGGQLDTIIDTLETTLTAIETDQAAIEVLLTGIDSDTDAIKTAVQILDDWDDSNYANVNINLAGSDAPTGGGAESGALRVTLANDSTGVISIDDGGNTITVDGTVSVNSHAVTNAGTFAVQAGHDITGMVSGANEDVGTSAEILRALGNVACKRVDVIASSANTGVIWVGGSNLTADAGIPLSPGDFYSVDVDGTSDIYVLAAVNGEDVYFNYFT